MTNKEAAALLEQQKNEFLEHYVDYSGVVQAYNMAINLLNKQDKPKMVVDISDMTKPLIHAHCPNCGRAVEFAERYCHNCTQPLEWPVEEIVMAAEEGD